MLKNILIIFVFLMINCQLCAQNLKNADSHRINSACLENLDYRNLSFLKPILQNTKVFLLGEPTHGEGNIFETNTQIVKYLVEECGFEVIAFESGFYDLYKARQNIQEGEDFLATIEESIYPIWTKTLDFQPFIQYLYDNQHKLIMAGFDPQVGSFTAENLLDDIQEFLKNDKNPEKIKWDYLQQIIDFMSQNFAAPQEYDNLVFKILLEKIKNRLNAFKTPESSPKIAVWTHTLEYIYKLAQDYKKNNPANKTKAEFKAKDANLRDRLMAENKLFAGELHLILLIELIYSKMKNLKSMNQPVKSSKKL
jgi:erythromycin esterase-like protein